MTSVEVVCRSRPSVNAIRGVVESIDSFLDATRCWAIARVCFTNLPGAPRLLSRLAVYEDQDVDPLQKHQRFANLLVSATTRGDLPVVQ